MAPTPQTVALTTAENIMVSTILVVFLVLGTILNGIVLVTLFNDPRSLKEPRNLVVFARALIDGLQSIVICPMRLFSVIAGRWTTGFSGCIVYAFIVSWFGLTSIQLNALMAYERYYVLSKIPLGRMSERLTCLYILACFLAGFVTSCFPLFGWSGYSFEGLGYHCSVEWYGSDINHASYSIFLLVFFYVVPVTIIVVSGILIYKSVQRLRSIVKEIDGKDSLLSKVTYRAQLKATRIVTVMIVGFLMAWTPYGILALYAITHKDIPVLTSGLPSNIAKTALIYNPIIYLSMSRRLRRKSMDTVRSIFYNIMGTTGNPKVCPTSGQDDRLPRQPVSVIAGTKVVDILSMASSLPGTSPSTCRVYSRRNAWSPS